jgi:ribosomal protein L11 methyltransferase
MMYRHWRQITIRIDDSYQDLLVGQLTLLGFTGFSQEQKVLHCIIPDARWTDKTKKIFSITLDKFNDEFPSLVLSYSSLLIRNENWNKKWEKSTGIVEATDRIIIQPSWKKLPKRHRGKLVLHIDPKMSFGTGHHETTRLSLHLIERFLQPGMEILDFGCGTGILGIACVKLGAKSAVAVDNDPWSIDNARENIKRNLVRHHIVCRLGSVSIIPRRKFDLIVANIDFPTISRFLPSIVRRLRSKSVIILSGILTSDRPALLPLCQKNSLLLLEQKSENEWTSFALRRI